MISIDDVVVGLLVDAIAATGRRLGAMAGALSQRRRANDLALARWFDTYRLTEQEPVLPEVPASLSAQIAEILNGDEVQATLHELLAVRLTDAPETDVERVREVFDITLGAADGELAAFSAALFGYYDNQICELVGRLEGGQPALLQQIRDQALNARMIAILSAIERHTAALSSVRDQRSDADFLARYQRHVADQHGKIEPPDFERRRRVPIADIYVSARITQVMEADAERTLRELDLWQLAQEIDRTVLLGDPGGGKTTAANVLLHHFASDAERRIPFLVTLRDFAAKDPPERSVARHIEHTLEIFYQCPAPAGLVDRLLLTGRALVIFDGLDELLDTSRRADVTTRVERFCAEYPLAPVLVTSRLVGYDEARLDDRQFVRYRLDVFGESQVDEYARKWFAHEEGITADQAQGWAQAFLDESASVPDLRANPLLLSLMCILYRGEGSLPRTRDEIYEQCATLLFRKWDARRRIHSELRAGHLLAPALRHLAWWMFTRNQAQPAVTETELISETTAFLHGRGFESEEDAIEAAREFVEFSRGRMWVFSDAGTTAAGQRLYAFTHRTFLEYFAAAHLAFASDTPEQLGRTLAPHVARNEWEVVGELAAQIKDHTSQQGIQRLYLTLLGERRRRSAAGRGGVLQFLARCLGSVDPPPSTVRELARATLDHLLSGDVGDPVWCLPLCWLLASCNTYRHIVSEEISARISVMIASNDYRVRRNGLLLAISLPVGFSGNWSGRGPTLAWHSPLSVFWQERTVENVRGHTDDIVAIASSDAGVRFAALQYDLITVEQALEMHGGLLPLLQVQPTEIFDIRWGSYLVSHAYHLARGWSQPFYPGGPDFVSKANSDFGAVGRYLLAHPNPPWITGIAYGLSGFNWEPDVRFQADSPRLDPVTYLGTAATLLISAECTEPELTLDLGEWSAGPLNDLYPYIMNRVSTDTMDKLPELPVPVLFGELFRDWAQGNVNLVRKSAKA
jgi:NACHT domain